MGIPGLYGRWLSKEVVRAIFQGLPLFVASLAFDLNGVYHDARKTVLGEGVTDPRILQAIANTDPAQIELEIQNAAEAIILRMVNAANPRDCLILAVDGVAPGAKLQQQKGRRERAARERSPMETFDKNAITPGTDFMIRLDNFMIRFIGKYRNLLPPKVIYSSHLVPGEGEHKIMDCYRRGEVSDGPAAKEGGAHVLYGLDADLIMLSLLAPINNIYLSRESVKETVNIDRIKDYLMERGKRATAVDDFVVMMYLLGNDFLPHMHAFEEMSEAISLLLEIYQNSNYVLTRVDDNGRHHINWDDMKMFLGAVAARENELLAALSVRQVTYPSRFLQAALREGQFYPDVFRSTWYQNALGPKGPQPFTDTLTRIIARYVPTEQDVDQRPITTISEVTPQRITNMAVDYMRTMSWTYLYYREGTAAVNHDWAYPYHHSPILVDLAAVAQHVQTNIPIIGYEAYEGMLMFTALHQLVAVIPLKSKDLLPLELQPLFSYNSIIRDLLPENFIVEVDGKNEVRTGQVPGVPIVPMIDRRRIIEAVAQIVFTPERAQLWMPATEQIFTMTPDEIELVARFQFDKQRQADFVARQAQRGDRGRGRRGEFRQQAERAPQQRGLVPTMTQTQAARAPRSPGTERGRGRGRGRGDRGDRGGRGRGGREAGQREVRRPPTQTGTQPPVMPPVTAPTQVRIGQTVIQRPPPAAGRAGRGPTLVPIGTTAPTNLPIGRGTMGRGTGAQVTVTPVAPPVVPIGQIRGQTTQQGPRSPAQWKQLPTLM